MNPIITDSYIQSMGGETEINSSCNNLSLEETSFCLEKELRTFYNYNLSNIDTILTNEELIKQGGVCWHYANWYHTRMLNLGFYSKEVSIKLNETMNHRFTIASNNQAYCILDQLNVNCYDLV